MKHLYFTRTPITPLNFYSQMLDSNIMAKRDDLFMEGGGGSKARMLQYILADVKGNYDVLVTAGGPYSNFNRACALICAKLGIAMHLVEYTDNSKEYELSSNYYICTLCGIKTTRCGRSDVAMTIEQVMESYAKQGIKAKFVYAGGKCLEGFYAYYDAVREVKEQGIKFDSVFLACGTGTTLTGICAGMQRFYPKVKVHAISVARKWEVEKTVLDDDLKILNDYLQTNYSFDNLRFFDNYISGGYAKYDDHLFSTIKECISREGMLIDPTYSGKAFHGMKLILKSSNDYKGKNILFWNTGGLFNLLSKEE